VSFGWKNWHFWGKYYPQREFLRTQKIKAITQWTRPKNAIEVRSFLGLAGYYHMFVQNFCKIATPFTNLTRKTTKYEWTDECKGAFQELKKRLTSAPVLALPTNDENLVVYSDVSKNRLGHVLMQKNHVHSLRLPTTKDSQAKLSNSRLGTSSTSFCVINLKALYVRGTL